MTDPILCSCCGTPARRAYALRECIYYLCPECHTYFMFPLPTPEGMKNYAEQHYLDGVYAQYTKARELKVATCRERLKTIGRYAQGKKLIDLGCSCGFMVEAALEAGYDARGVEFSEAAVKAAAPAIRERITVGDIHNLKGGGYDVVTAFDILEHTRDPLGTLRQWATLLNPRGILVIATPNTDSLFRKIMGSRWPMLQPYQHTFLFSGKHFGRLLEKSGLHPLELRPAIKVMTPGYLAKQLELYFPLMSRLSLDLGRLFPRFSGLPIPFRIGEFLSISGKK